ncbi:MAG: 54S ribosomal 3 protein [Lasallia pustulata]|uniref:Large ribosomal subunit protein mL44 n=1 Tax=Lasallia pustulata TaxID=136370 RepID=A0A1W5CSM8_9LECA|nr:MAG: 54S ribosomal 3 protein [Lasallia pustulata]SLM33833.1 Ribonuclease III domain [Lasallia pustulata]
MWAYSGPKTLTSICREWGVDAAAEPGGEVDPGYLQAKRSLAGNAPVVEGSGIMRKETKAVKKVLKPWNRGLSSQSIKDDYFGEERRTEADLAERPELREGEEERGVTLERASVNFVKAVMGAVYLHGGRNAAKLFFKEHILSRHLEVGKMFEFRQPTRDLSRLCAREGFESPVARILSETGRASRHPVFVVGVFSGKDMLGEGAGGSLDEARIRAAIAALKGWYLYSPMNVVVPSDVEGEDGKPWQPVLVDGGEVIV